MPPLPWAPAHLITRAAERLFRHLEIDDAWREAVDRALERGPVVYVLRNVSSLDYLALLHLVDRLGLPPIGFANELNPLLSPYAKLKGAAASQSLEDAIENGHSAVLFLKRAPKPAARTQRGRSEGSELLASLLAMQIARPQREIMMMPQTFVWSQRPERHGFSVVDAIFGPTDFPGDVRQSAQFLLNYRNALLRAGDPMSLREFLHTQGEPDSDSSTVRRLTYALLRKVERERRSIVGPAHKAPDRLREEVLRSPRLQTVIKELAGPGSEQRNLLTNKARRMLDKMQSIPDVETQRSLELLANRLLDRVYSGIDVDSEGIERLRQLSQEGSVVLLPSHKSHIDYIVLSAMLRKNSIQLPVVAAGDNLSFFPAGPLLRRAGAFFIRRSFRRDRLYVAVVDAYLRRLLRDGWIIEFFLEGGRSRTGKLLPPMLGLLNMIVAAGLQLERRRVFFMPVAIGYERLMEEGAFARELSGEEKQSEDAGQLLKLGGVLIDRWGRVNIQFGEALELSDLRAEVGAKLRGALNPAKRRAIVKRLAHRVMSEINRVTALTPGALTALVLLSHGPRGIAYRDLLACCQSLATLLLAEGARATPSLMTLGPPAVLRETGIRDALKLYLKGGLVEQHVPGDTLTTEGHRRANLYSGSDVIFTVPNNKRLHLDLPKNTIIHHLIDRALIAVAYCSARFPSTGDEPKEMTAKRLRSRVQSLSRLFKYEFMFRADASFDEIFDESLARMVDSEELAVEENGPITTGKGHGRWDGLRWLQFYAATLLNLIEAYRVTARTITVLCKGPLSRKDIVKRALRDGERMFLKGGLQRSEAVNRPMIENALSAFCDQGYLVSRDDKLSLSDSFQTPHDAATIEARISAFQADLGSET